MRICTKCKEEKTDSEFPFRNKIKGIYHSHCKQCKREIDNKSYEEDRNGRRSAIRKTSLLQIRKAREFVKRLKMFGKCSKCGDERWYVLDFHHIDGKDWNIGELASRGPSLQRLKTEIRKCVLLCANCHREEHYIKRSSS